tara:strand:+ start:257 stop:403 length:147 start_codon:yes stop_codon:yes gene_type:complete
MVGIGLKGISVWFSAKDMYPLEEIRVETSPMLQEGQYPPPSHVEKAKR